MKKEVVTYECDNCEATATPENLEQPNPLPLGWIELSIQSNHGSLANLQLCVMCEEAVKNALRDRGVEGRK